MEKYIFKASGYIYSSPALTGNTAYFGDFSGKLYALDLKSQGKNFKEYHTSGRIKNKNLLKKEGSFNINEFTKDKDMSIYQTNVELMDRMYELGPILSSPVVKDGVIYLAALMEPYMP